MVRSSDMNICITFFTSSFSHLYDSDDLGSHHICIDVSSTSGGNFCKVTRQSDWCSSTMPCHEGSGLCPVQDWCVCQWAFASYIHNAGGCNHIQNIKCDAVNMHALEAYKRDGRYQEAYKCISQKCGLSSVSVEI